MTDAIVNWGSLFYGYYLAGYEAQATRNDGAIAMGCEAALVAIIDFLWAGRRRELAWSLLLTGMLSPFVAWGAAPRFWPGGPWLGPRGMWPMLGLGAAIGVPLFILGWNTLHHARAVEDTPQPAWYTVARWSVRIALFAMLLAFQNGSWNEGIAIVIGGALIVVFSLAVALPRRIHVTAEGVGKLLVGLGVSAIGITIAAVAGGAHMNGGEAMAGILPAVLVLIAGVVVGLKKRP